jgi:putative ATP-dependent endonuclease of the OLD family
MPLRWIEVENYRAIARGRVTFADTTVLFGENDSGRTSIIEALLLSLGAPGRGQDELTSVHFHHGDEGRPGPLHIRLGIEEGAPGEWFLPDRLEDVFPPVGTRQLIFDFRADLDHDLGTARLSHTVHAPVPSGQIDGGPDTANWLRGLFPVLWLQSGLLTGIPEPDSEVGIGQGDPIDDPMLQALAVHHRNILTGNTLNMDAELEAGAETARVLLDKYSNVFAGSGQMMSAMVSEILDRRPSSTVQRPHASTASQKIAVLLVLGALLQLVRQVLREGPLPEHSTPILVIENPEVNLHPITLATVWRTIEGITWQKIVATHSDGILADAPLTSLRRLTRRDGVVEEWAVAQTALTGDALRKVSYHLRSRRASAMFARCWLLVEGETEYWVLPDLARVCGYDFAEEGVACVEFAQSGVAPFATLAHHLGIAWHVMVDGDEAGRHYAETVQALALGPAGSETPVTVLREPDIEHCFWRHGFADVIAEVANVSDPSKTTPTRVIRKAIERTSKPFLALTLIDAAAGRGPESVPPILRHVIEATVALARA